jgi:transcriptional regulator with XRE-family HTH domain
VSIESWFDVSVESWPAYARQLGANVHAARVNARWTQEKLAATAGITRTHLQQIERGAWRSDGTANPTIKVLVRLAIVLEIDVAVLLPSNEDLRFD